MMRSRYSSMLQTMMVLAILFVLPTLLQAQPTSPADPQGDPAPIDGGVSIVAAACAGYLARRKQKSKQ